MQANSDIAKKVGAIVKQLRVARRMTGVELANRVGLSQSAISKIENGYKDTEQQLVEKILNILEAPLTIRQQVALLYSRNKNDEYIYDDRFFDFASTKGAVRLVRSTQRFSVFTVATFPFYVQTIDYREALLKGVGVSSDFIQEALADMQPRQDLLWDTSKKFEILFTEMALYTRLTSVITHIAQLDRVERLLMAGRLDIGIIPLEFGLIANSVCAFALYDSKLLVRNIGNTEIETKEQRVIDDHKQLFATLKQKALYGSEAIALVRKAARYFEA
ncbi:helix-turn-helix transcriptional regulator [Candidatus Saccharibacteria bacterium]|nr:helix-turn-helix transcriptional regulator [Candidatus Saccharibacteria bacterium]